MDLDGLLTDTTETSFLVNMKTGIETIKNLETWLSTWKQLLTQEHCFQLGNFPTNFKNGDSFENYVFKFTVMFRTE